MTWVINLSQFKYAMVKKSFLIEMEKICMVSGIEGSEIDEILDALLFLYILFTAPFNREN